jgi:hypothetical protein
MRDLWSLNPLAALACRHWEGETVVHHQLSNDTYRLAEPTGWILGRLGASAALTVDEIAADSPYDVADLTPALCALAELGLIQRC